MTGNGKRGNGVPVPMRPADASPRARLKRFYSEVGIGRSEGGWRVLLDGRAVKTPLGRPLEAACEPLVAALAEEWRAQAAEIDRHAMLLNRLANTAIDGAQGREADIRAGILAYAGSDLICYRAGHPAALRALQEDAWGPILAWFESAFGVHLAVGEGVMPLRQDEAQLGRIAKILADEDAFALTAILAMTTITGSALIALAHARERLSLEEAWSAANVDEDWQTAHWGVDAEAAARRARRFAEMEAASRFLNLIRSDSAQER